MKWIDLPPVWLVICLFVAWAFPVGLAVLFWPGIVLLVIAAVLTVLAMVQFGKAKTTMIPHKEPDALIDGGIYRWSRNPIYLADLLILAGFSLIWGSLPGILLILPLAMTLQKRFILPEEARLQSAFGQTFDDYRARTRRWI